VRLVPSYRPGASALHAARASAGMALCGAYVLAAMLYDNPLVLTGALVGVCAAAAGAGVIGELRRAAWLALPLAVLVVLINALVTRGGSTVIARGGEVLGRRLDITLEAVQYGGMSALRILVLVAAFALYSAAIDPDDVLRLLRRFSYRSALTVSLATRLVPVLQRDAQRISEAACCRPVHPRRGAVAVAAITRALDRAVDVAASLELRGYAGARRPRRERRPWSRHDLRVIAAAALVAGVAIGGKLLGAGGVDPYPTLDLAAGTPEALLAGALVLAGAAPFAGSGARLGVARLG
jgi:energy-coupling factor transport system permease protein